MIKFFRKIRQNLLTENKFSKYFFYASGEIMLVVIGILIALSINNWNNVKKDRKLEKHYIIGLINDLQLDSVAVDLLKQRSDEQVLRKEKLIDYFNGETFSNDSLTHFFGLQWGLSVGFNPNKTMLDEMTSTGGIGVIQDPEVRKEIVKIYNDYQIFINGIQASYEGNRSELRKLVLKIPNVFTGPLTNAATPDIIAALKTDELRNAILANYASSVNGELNVLQENNRALLKLLTEYLSKL